jgi:hypothetical protein
MRSALGGPLFDDEQRPDTSVSRLLPLKGRWATQGPVQITLPVQNYRRLMLTRQLAIV